MNSLIIDTSGDSISFGIFWAFVRNCVIPPANICMMYPLASSDGDALFHFFRVLLTLSRTGFHGVHSLRSLPIQAPRHLTGCPSTAIRMSGWRGGSEGWTRHVETILALCHSVLPIGTILVFSRLKCAPKARHQCDSIRCRSV